MFQFILGYSILFLFLVLQKESNYVKRLRQTLLDKDKYSIPISVQSLSHVQLFATPWTAARQASLSITNSCSLLKLISIESVMPSNHLILCRPLLLLPSIFPSIRVFSNYSALHIRWPKYYSFSFNSTHSPNTKSFTYPTDKVKVSRLHLIGET